MLAGVARLVPGVLVAMALAAGAAALGACGDVLEIDDGSASGDGGDGEADRRDGSRSTPDGEGGDGAAPDASAACKGDGGTSTEGCAPAQDNGGTRRCNTFSDVLATGPVTRDDVTFVSPPASLKVEVDRLSKTGVVVDSYGPEAFQNAVMEADIQLLSVAERADLAQIVLGLSTSPEPQTFFLEAAPNGEVTVSASAQQGAPRQRPEPIGFLCPGSFTHVRMLVQYPAVDAMVVTVTVTLPNAAPATRSFFTVSGGSGTRNARFTLGVTVAGTADGTSSARFDNWSTHVF